MRYFVILGFVGLVSASCSDLAGKTYTQTQCYESITCQTSTYSTSGTFCGSGSGTFSYTSTWYNCLPAATSTLVTTVSACVFNLFPANYCTGISGYKSVTLTDAEYPAYVTGSTTCYGNAAIFYQTIVSWKSGVYAGIAGITSSKSTTTTSRTPSVLVDSQGNSTSTPTPAASSTVPIIVGVAVAVVVIIAAIIGFVIVRKMRAKGTPVPTSLPPTDPSYQPSYQSSVPYGAPMYQQQYGQPVYNPPQQYYPPQQNSQTFYAPPGAPPVTETTSYSQISTAHDNSFIPAPQLINSSVKN
ncbi:hypothetical protein HK096_005888 [Nowakowskiella sp. JEL0078]|nr:hypothetical protein HK096_005888 [Nowakowskiella sp. JEL0078]